MYELKKFGKVFTRKFVGTGPSPYKKRIYRASRGLTKVDKHWAILSRLLEVNSMTFAQRRKRLTTHFSKRIPVVRRRMSVFT